MVENFGGNFGGFVDIVITVVDDFGLDDGDDAGLLAEISVFCEIVAVLSNGFVGRGEDAAILTHTEFEGGAPFGEAEAHLIVFGEAAVETVETFSEGFKRIRVQGFETLVDFDARDDALASEIINEILTVIGNLTGGLIEENDTIDVVGETRGSKEDIAIVATIIVGIGDLKLVEFFANATTRFVGGENTFGIEDEVARDEFEIVGGLAVAHRLELL